MKKVSEVLLFAAFLAVGSVGYSRTIDPPYEVGTWSGFRTAAITYTFDDQCSNQFVIAIPLFNEFGFKSTLYPVINWGPNWTNIQNAAATGHEVGSHTMSHPTNLGTMTIAEQTAELVNSQNAINSHIPGQQCDTISYPNCNPSTQSLTAQYYLAGRTCSGAIVPSTPSNFYQISSIILGNSGINTTAGIIAKDTAAATAGGWCVFLIHGIDSDGGWSPLSSTILRESVQYLDAHRSTFWVSSFGNVVRYIKERNAASVTESSNTGDSITLQVTDTLDDAIYNYPVTMRRPLPAGWASADVSQDGQAVASSIVVVNSTAYVMFDVVPDGGDVVLSKGI